MTILGMLLWRPVLHPLLCGAIIIAASVWVYWVYRRMLARLTHRRALVLMVPKVIVLVLLVLALFEPVWSVEKPAASSSKLLVLTDDSSSMDVKDDNRQPRADRAELLVKKMKREIPSDVTIETKEFDTDVHKPGDRKATGVRGTDLAGCLLALSDQADISSYMGVVLVTDGGDEHVESAALPPVPLSIIGVGTDPATWNDLSIADVQAPATAEKEVDFEVSADLVARSGGGQGFASRLGSVGVTFEHEVQGQWERIQNTTASLVNGRARVKFKTQSKETGLERYRIGVEQMTGELSYLNNSRPFAVDVQKKSLHVLYFTRELGMDFKMIRNELARDPGVAFTALFRTVSERFTLQGDRVQGDEDLESGFPDNEAQLKPYDCIILGSFPTEDWPKQKADALIKFVEDGGVVILLGGEDAFGSGQQTTPLAALLPWQLPEGKRELQRGTFAVNIPLGSTGHPIMAGLEELIGTRGATIESANPMGGLKPGATALLNANLGDRIIAVVAMQPYGKGKVMVVGTNTMWKWVTQAGLLRDAFGRFWRQAVRNLTGKTEGGRVLSVRWDKDSYRPGEQATVEIRVTAPTKGEAVRLSASVTQNKETKPLTPNPIAGQANAYSVNLRFHERGEYFFRLVAYQGDIVLESYEKTLPVAPLVAEGSHLEVDEQFLRQLAEKAGGQYLRETDVDEFIKSLSSGLWAKTVTIERPIAQSGPHYIVLFLIVCLVEWILRRRMNLF